MADLRVDYQLLAWTTRTLSVLASEFAHAGDELSSHDQAYGSGAIAAAMGTFAGNWSDRRTTLLRAMEHLGQLTAATEQRFRRADSAPDPDLASG